MTDYLLDTNHVSPLVTVSHPLRYHVLESLNKGHMFFISVPVLAEMLYGIGVLPRAKQNLAEWTGLKSHFPCLIPDEIDAERAAQLQISLRRQGWQLETIDALIATIALRYNLTLLTSDNDFKMIPELRRENWLQR